jgi:hypothetical protein
MTKKQNWGLTSEQTSGFIYMHMDDRIIRTMKFTNRRMRRDIMKTWNAEISRMSKKHRFEISIKLDT